MARSGGRFGARFLPPDPRVEGPWRMTPQLALRLGVLGALALTAFGVLFFRLWALQVLSGEQYLVAAQNNQLRNVRIEAPRGTIVDRKGRVLVDNVAGTAVQLWTADLPAYLPARNRILRRLSRILGVPLKEIQRKVAARRSDPLTPVVVAEDVSDDRVFYLQERQREFPGVRTVDRTLRDYKFPILGAHVLGHVGEITQEQLERRRGYRLGDRVGQSGLEAAYDRYLRGRDGSATLRVDSLGRPRSNLRVSDQAEPGLGLRLTLDVELQRAAQRALNEGIELAHAKDKWYAAGGAIVALDPRNGSVLALASNPTYDPRVFVGKASKGDLRKLVDQQAAEDANFPALNRATTGLYPPGSTFKPVTALAAMEEGVLGAYESIPCTPDVTISKQVFRNWNPFVNEAMSLPTALSESCDTYFYELGVRFYYLPKDRGSPLQKWAATFGFGSRTGIDISPEEPGLLPTPAWRRATFEHEIDRLWKTGDSVQLAIGQKDLLVTPLQMARFYALIANGGKLVTPHLVSAVEQSGSGRTPDVVVRGFAPQTKEIALDRGALRAVQDGLYLATHSGTSSGVFGNFQVGIAGKTGTAEKVIRDAFGTTRMEDQSWWCGYGPAGAPSIVVCALIENGGHGGDAAAPAALRVFEEYFDEKAPTVDYVLSD